MATTGCGELSTSQGAPDIPESGTPRPETRALPQRWGRPRPPVHFGHGSAAMTLDTCAELFPDDLDSGARSVVLRIKDVREALLLGPCHTGTAPPRALADTSLRSRDPPLGRCAFQAGKLLGHAGHAQELVVATS